MRSAAGWRPCRAGRFGPVGSAGEGGDLDAVVGQDAPSAPDVGAVDSGEPGPVPTVLAFEGGDAGFGPGAPLHEVLEGGSVFDVPASSAGWPGSGDRDRFDSELFEGVINPGVAVATIGGGQRLPDPLACTLRASWCRPSRS